MEHWNYVDNSNNSYRGRFQVTEQRDATPAAAKTQTRWRHSVCGLTTNEGLLLPFDWKVEFFYSAELSSNQRRRFRMNVFGRDSFSRVRSRLSIEVSTRLSFDFASALVGICPAPNIQRLTFLFEFILCGNQFPINEMRPTGGSKVVG